MEVSCVSYDKLRPALQLLCSEAPLASLQQGRGEINRRDGVAQFAERECVPSGPSPDLEDGTSGRKVPGHVAPSEIVLQLVPLQPLILILDAQVVEGRYVADVVCHTSFKKRPDRSAQQVIMPLRAV